MKSIFLVFWKVLREMFMFVTTVCQPEYSGTFEVLSVAEYHQSFIQKKLKKTFVYKSFLDKKKKSH